uniref:Uncharacterized protein n=1 Tax=Kalanchoe fedtschenkoi TaxID=63787 RepID=A0A7N0ZXV7_KALFE
MDVMRLPAEAQSTRAKRYWRRNKYYHSRLPGSVPPRRKLPVLKLGGQDPDHQRRWKLKSPRKLKLRALISPIRLLAKLRDAYIKMMLNLDRKMGMGRVSFSNSKRAEGMMAIGGHLVDARLVVEIYNRMVADKIINQTEAAEHIE